METVIQALKAMGKATAREVASRLDIEPATALNMLREHEATEEVTQINGYWVLTAGKPVSAKPVRTAVRPPVKVTVNDLIKLLNEHGPKSSAELATLARIESKRVAPMLTYHMTKGQILREKIDGKFVYSVRVDMPEGAVAKELVTVAPEPEPATVSSTVTDVDKPLEQFVSEIPSFTERHVAGQIIPTVHVISREIRRTRNKLASLEKLREAVRVVGRHKNLVQQLANTEAGYAETKNA
ncbi:DUF1627 domain-containing protein [Leclercia adecarboxylata]|uniref:DUF1627 domain-containing protein n=1 Tax=Leclercia adecarboxylata TaxID=83655 RepID=UPI002948F3C5|nr:DUF1627 domain-containing protein [Leclercia adecarboxylata]MDV5239171.1 DUF1627 domain-containing protein [Leclercia adecarboxylata]MDV5275710.1 DUF1627 domain-containing protein [Leclercia adecarboxylata]MDV5461706.1 DUF1627 domain-containing protein [Leclercia adecarboxylata]MDV5503146.1 DUF1627 domain-containing protein [Leclercia adecarboxylata]MDV5533256.1 DUF1627 domain-containing protein [Leclercia adecarboxylata]